MTDLGIHVNAKDLPYLDSLNDCVLVCQDGIRVNANTYALVTSSGVFHSMFDETNPEDPREFNVDVDSTTMQCIVDLTHGKRAPDWTTEQIVDTLRALDYLDCHVQYPELVSLLWDRVYASFHEIRAHARYLSSTRLRALIRRCVDLVSTYSEFRTLFDHLEMTPIVASTVLDLVADTYPPVNVVRDILSHVSKDHLFEVAMKMLTLPSIGITFHPDEFHIVLRMLFDAAPGDSHVAPLIKTCLDAFGSVNHPSVTSKIWGSFLTYRSNKVSYLLHFTRPWTSKASVRFHGCQFTTDQGPVSTMMDLESTIYLSKITYDDVDEVTIRVSTMRYRDDMVGVSGHVESIYDFSRLDESTIVLRTVDPLDYGKVSFSHRFDHPETLKFIRLDLTWT